MKKILSAVTVCTALLVGALSFASAPAPGTPYAEIDPEICIKCGACVPVCPLDAIDEL